MNTFKIISIIVGFVLFGAGCFIFGYGSYKHDQRLNVDDFIKTYVRYQELRTRYSQYFNKDETRPTTEYDIRQYILQNMCFKHGSHNYHINGKIVELETIQFKRLVILNYNPNINIIERLQKINSLFDLYV